MTKRLYAILGVVLFVATGRIADLRAQADRAYPTPEENWRFGSRPECPRHDGIVVQDKQGNWVIQQSVAASTDGATDISLIPEFHDCQKLLSSDKKRFGPLVAIFARIWLDEISRLDRAAATLYDYGQAYNPLLIQPGWNCLYVFPTSTSAASPTWAAMMFDVNSDTDCIKSRDEVKASFPGGTLPVSVMPAGSTPPPVARWDWDGGQHYIGIRCGDRWCEVGRSGPSSLVATMGGSTLSKGSYDQQYLAVSSGAADNLVPAGPVGTIAPLPLPAGGEAPFQALWVDVAKAYLSEAVPKYAARFNLGPAARLDQGVVIALCKGSKEACLPRAFQGRGMVNTCKQDGDGTADPWWARITFRGKSIYRCVSRRKHEGIAIPDVVRWRWNVTDEGIWRACPGGCCEVT